MLRARRLVTLWQRAQPLASSRAASEASLALLSGRLARVQVGVPSVLAQLRWQSSESLPTPQIEADEATSQLLLELDACRETGKWRQALKLLDRIDKDASLPPLDPAMYERAIAACARMGKVEVLPGLLSNMMVDDLRPTSATVDFVMQAYLAKEHWDLVVSLASNATTLGVPLSPAAVHATMEACGQTKDAASAVSIMKQLSNSGAEMTTDLYAAAIRAAGMGRRADKAMALFVQMEDLAGLKADAEAFSQLIRAQIVNRELDQALQSFATVMQRGLQVDEPIYTATIDALVSHDRHWQATRLFEQMLEQGEKHPSVFCLGRAMAAYVGANRSQHAWACWNKVVEMKEPHPMSIKYAKILEELTHAKDSELAVAVFDHMNQLFEPGQIHQKAYTTAIRAHGRLGHTQQAVDLFEQFVASRPNDRRLGRFAGIYLALFNALSRDTQRDPALNTRDAKRAWDIMAANVPVVLPPAYASLAGVFASSGEMETLQELIEHAERSWGVTAVELEQDEDDEELELAVGFEGDEESPVEGSSSNDVLLFNGVISGLSKARDDQTASIEQYLDMMQSRGMPIVDSIVRATTDACVRFENWPLMLKLAKLIDVAALQNAEVCLGDTVSKLLEAHAWKVGREWLVLSHRLGLNPPVRRKMELLRELSESQSKEWRVAYALAIETMSFRRLVQANVDCVADAADVCMNAKRGDLAIKLFDSVAGHASLRHSRKTQRQMQTEESEATTTEPLVVPMRMYKNAVLSLLRKSAPDSGSDDGWRMPKAERICKQMLEAHGKQLDGDALSMAISIKATVGDDDDVGALYESMRALQLPPNSYAQNAAIIAFSRLRRTDQVLAIRDDLLNALDSHGQVKRVGSNVAKSLLLSLAIAHQDDALLDAAQNLPGCSMNLVMNALLETNRLATAVALLDESVSSNQFTALLKRISGSNAVDPVLGAALLLKYARLHGVAQLQPPKFVLRVATKLVASGNLAEAEQVLHLYLDGSSDVALKQMPPYFQQEVVEMLLFIYGEFGRFDDIRALFDKELLAFPLNVAHFEAAMEYCAQSRDELAGAVASLKLFETLRTRGFIQPSGYTYLLTLQSCLRLERLEPTSSSGFKSTGQVIMDDVREHGFRGKLVLELTEQVATTLRQTLSKDKTVASRARTKQQGTRPAARPMEPTELARLALFCHRNGLAMSANLNNQLLAMRQHLPVAVANELAFVQSSFEKEVAAPKESLPAEAETPEPEMKKPAARAAPKAKKPQTAARSSELKTKPRAKRTRSKSQEAATRLASDSRWGELYLQPLPFADKE
ncbi:hypothetical protein BBJ28_00022335 [Nothophytophthora sp. Chile5]|nr:hypothetical protein BBJ28_00022335 [Nothophytophthora sp. Chile5]